MNQGLSLLGGLGLGAGLMYFLDPDVGRRRRVRLRDRAVRVAHDAEHSLEATWNDLRHRAQGMVAETASRFKSGQADDRVVTERVRSKMGRYVSHPSALDVGTRNGRVTLRGPILAPEVNGLLNAVSSVPGVTGVENQLDVHEEAGPIAALQGGSYRPGERINPLEGNWAPATRFLVAAAGCGLMTNCLIRCTPAAALLGTAGFGLLVSSLIQGSSGRKPGRGAAAGPEEAAATSAPAFHWPG